ncbi:MAG TPA: hypothetical protein VGL66_06850 [Caulobacteraceae bacterium]
MAILSVTTCATEGFSVIRRRPWAFAGWILFWLILGMGPFLIALAGLAPKLIDFVGSVRSAHDAHDPVAVQRLLEDEFGVLTVLAPWGLWLMVISTVLFTAVLRAVLEPEKSAFAYLRLGMDEVRLFFLRIVYGVLAAAFMAAIVGAGVVLFIATDRYIGHPWEGWIDVLVIVLGLCLLIWVLFRLSLSFPMTFADKRLRIFESWSLTRGHFWGVVGVWALSVLLVVAVAIGFMFVRQFVFLVIGLSTGAFDQLGALETMGDDLRKGLSTIIAAFGPAFIGLFVIQAIADALTRVVFIAPFARAYAQLSGRAPPAEPGS